MMMQGWAQGPMRDSTLEYRLSIVRAEEGDTGEYTCTTPFKKSHSIRVVVMNITCPPVIQTRGLVLSSNSSILNTRWGRHLALMIMIIVLYKDQFYMQ